jgi:hypothetical protein
MTSRSEVHHANNYTIEASHKKGQRFYAEVYNVLLFCEVKIRMHVTDNEWILGLKKSWCNEHSLVSKLKKLGPRRLNDTLVNCKFASRSMSWLVAPQESSKFEH